MKPSWLVIAFAGGVAVGVVVTRVAIETPAGTAMVTSEIPASRANPSVASATVSIAMPAPATSTRAALDSNAGPPPAPPSVPSVAPTPEPISATDGAVVQPIDAGPVFSEMLERPSVPGFENQIGDAHRELERETRNDGWAYTMEAEFQNAMLNETSTGAFRADHVECRATLCEVRLSGKGDQGLAIKRWSEGIGAQPFGQRLFLNYSSSISNSERVDALMIFRKAPATQPRPR